MPTEQLVTAPHDEAEIHLPGEQMFAAPLRTVADRLRDVHDDRHWQSRICPDAEMNTPDGIDMLRPL